MKKVLRSTWGKLALIVMGGLLLRLITYGFIKIPWIIFDEFIYLDTARQIIRGSFLSQMSRDPQLYPAGWPLVLASFGGFIKNPFVQYKFMLILTMLISALIPVLVFFLTGSLWVSLAVALYPPLFVYSSSIMSETFYIFMLVLIVTVLKYIVKDDLKKKTTLILAAFIMGFFLYYTRLTRSFGVILIPAFVLSTLSLVYLQYKEKSISTLRQIVYFAVLTVFSYYFCVYLGKNWLFPKSSFYEKTAYIKAFTQALWRPRFSLVLLKNELTLSFFWLFFFLPVFWVHEGVKEWHKREWHLLYPRLFTFFIYAFSLILTFSHMFIGTKHNPQYLIFSRYLDPALVLLFSYGLKDFVSYLEAKTLKIEIPTWVYLLIGYFLFYFVFRLPSLDYKFGNTMSVYFFLFFKNSALTYWTLLIIVGLLYYALKKAEKKFLVGVFVFFFIWTWFFSVRKTLSTPEWVTAKYQETVNEWQIVMKNYRYSDTPLCIHKDGISSELYYVYHYLYPYQYLKSCSRYNKQRPKRIITRKTSAVSLPPTCVQDFKFSTNESIYYCPLGY